MAMDRAEEMALKKKAQNIQDATGIKQLTLKDKRHAVFSKVQHNINEQTGEVASQETIDVVKINSREDFLKLYIENLDFIYRLKDKEAKALLYIFEHLEYYNTINIGPNFRKGMEIALQISQPTVSRALDGLIKKGIIHSINTAELKTAYKAHTPDSYFVDPNIVGKGSFRDLERLRHTVIREYDLNKMELKTKVTTEHAYADFDEVLQNADKHRIVGVRQESDTNTKKIEILIAENDRHDEDYIDADVDEAAEQAQISNEQQPSLFSKQELTTTETAKDKQFSEALALENKKFENLQLELKKTNLFIIQRLMEAGKVDEALAMEKRLREKNEI